MAPQLDSFFKEVDNLSDSFIERLRKAVAIPSVSSEDERRPDVVKVWLHCYRTQAPTFAKHIANTHP